MRLVQQLRVKRTCAATSSWSSNDVVRTFTASSGRSHRVARMMFVFSNGSGLEIISSFVHSCQLVILDGLVALCACGGVYPSPA